jgi:glycosyltransferase involved in cell wall biosynthesis
VELPNLATLSGRVLGRRAARAQLRSVLADADRLVARLPSEIGGLACAVADELGVVWAVELVTCPWDAIWNYGTLKGRLFAPMAWWETRRLLRRAPFALYVTEQFLQRRYPPGGHAVGVSDVEIDPPGADVLAARLARIGSAPQPLRFGSIAALIPFKGLDTAFTALASANHALPPWEYHVLGAGDPAPYQAQAAAAGVGDRVFLDGTLPAGEPVRHWLDGIDVFLMPSRQEGLPRAMVEAMSRGCPALGSTVGGIPELLDADCLHRPGDAAALAARLARSADPAWQQTQARRNVEVAARYDPAVLDERRRAFWSAFADADEAAPRVLFVTPYAQLGGSERHLLHLLDQLNSAEVAGVVALQEGPLLDRLYNPVVIPTSARPLDMLRATRPLRRAIRTTKPDVVHAACAKGALIAGLAAVGTGVPVIFVKHDFYWDGPVAWLAAALSRRVVAVSHALNAAFPAVFERRLRVVHPGVPAAPVTPRPRRPEPTIGMVGRFHPDKGQLELVEALPLIPNTHAVFVGGPDASTPDFFDAVKTRVAELGLTDRVTFAGEQDGTVGWVASWDVAVVPTVVREGFGLVAVEAFRAGTPVVGYDHGGYAEVAGDCGVRVAPGDRTALADAVNRLLADPAERTRLAACGIQRAELFTIDAMVEGMRRNYREAASKVTSRMAWRHRSKP